MNAQGYEKYCAERLRLREGEQFFAVGDASLNQFLNPAYEEDLDLGRTVSLPDLLSFKSVNAQMCFRIREVKYKLEERLVAKAVNQLRSGLEFIHRKFDSPVVDRVEIVIPLNGRRLKKDELPFLGPELEPSRHELRIAGQSQVLTAHTKRYSVTLLLI